MYQPPGPWKAWENSLTHGRSSPSGGEESDDYIHCQSYPSLVSTDDRLSSTSVVLASQLLLQAEHKVVAKRRLLLEIIESHCVTSY